MSNPSVCSLASVNIAGNQFRVEDNLGEAIHIHYGRLRLSLSISDYFKVTDQIISIVEMLCSEESISIKNLDEESIKSDLLDDYKNIQSIKETEMELDSLFMRESFIMDRSIKRIIPLKESGYIKLLRGESDDELYYREKGKIEPSRYEKIMWIVKQYNIKDSTIHGKKIVVDRDGFIIDGIKRASALYYMYGGNTRIPVIMVDRRKKTDLNTAIILGEEKVREWLKQNGKVIVGSSNEVIEFKKLIDVLNELDEMEYIVEREKKIPNDNRSVRYTIKIKGNSSTELNELLRPFMIANSPYDKYRFIYSANRPVLLRTDNGIVIVTKDICCKTKYEDYYLPLDKNVLCIFKRHTRYCPHLNYYKTDELVKIFLIILDGLLEKDGYSTKDKEYIAKHKRLLEEKDLYMMLEKELYSYADSLLNYIRDGQYDTAISMYEKWNNY